MYLAGESPSDRRSASDHLDSRDPTSATRSDAADVSPHRTPLGTDLSALDALGMRIAVAYELLRLRASGCPDACLVRAGELSDEGSVVVDVHSPEAIREAEQSSPTVLTVMRTLQGAGVSRLYPGCDLLTIRDGVIDRMIELKSSTVDARVQEMSWNEWKTAGSSSIRHLFWLYLVGNLRADLEQAVPFVRAIHDPFGTLAAQTTIHEQRRRSVQLKVREFTQAEHLDLGLREAVSK